MFRFEQQIDLVSELLLYSLLFFRISFPRLDIRHIEENSCCCCCCWFLFMVLSKQAKTRNKSLYHQTYNPNTGNCHWHSCHIKSLFTSVSLLHLWPSYSHFMISLNSFVICNFDVDNVRPSRSSIQLQCESMAKCHRMKFTRFRFFLFFVPLIGFHCVVFFFALCHNLFGWYARCFSSLFVSFLAFRVHSMYMHYVCMS